MVQYSNHGRRYMHADCELSRTVPTVTNYSTFFAATNIAKRSLNGVVSVLVLKQNFVTCKTSLNSNMLRGNDKNSEFRLMV
jgi:hypothetical protein